MPRIAKFTTDDAQWRKVRGADILVGDVVDSTISDTVSVGYCRQGIGESNSLTTSFDEVFICLRGAYTLETEDGQKVTAGPGEVLWLPKDTPITYSGTAEEETLVVYVTYPAWRETEYSKRAADAYFEALHERPKVELI
jgi:ethanolamine utilization protein EutQ (cupin superfamily)